MTKDIRTEKQKEHDRIEEAKMRFSLMMKSPKGLTFSKVGSPYGDIPYLAQTKFKSKGVENE